MISIQNVSRRYGDQRAVEDVSLTIHPGEIVGLLGHNGAGKTTLMKMLTGYLEPSQGSIDLFGLDVVSERHSVQKDIGYLPENAPLYEEMLVQEYLEMMAELRGVGLDRRDQAVELAATRTGLVAQLARPIRELSKGYRQRVGIAQAIVHEPKLLVLDEPTNGLDPVQIRSIRELIRDIGKTSTIILSTHILQEVEAVCDRAVIMIGGSVSADDSLDALLTSNTYHMSVRLDADVQSGLVNVEGVRTARRLGTDPHNEGHVLWAIECDDGARPAPALLALAHEKQWPLQSLAPAVRTLESVFAELQEQDIARKEALA